MSEIRQAGRAGGLGQLSKHPIHLGKEAFEDRSGQERTVDRRGRQFGPRMPLVPSLPRAFPWGSSRAQDCRTLTKKPGWAGRGLHSIGRGWGGGAKMTGQFLALLPSFWGLELVFGTAYSVSLEVGGGGRGGARDLGFFP